MSDSRDVLFLCRYDRSGPSSRHRVHNLIGPLEDVGWRAQAHHLGRAYGTLWDKARASPLVARRLVDIARYGAPTWDGRLVVQKELLPPFSGFASGSRALRRRFAWDVDDAVWLRSRPARKQSEALARNSTIVVAGNSTIADWATAIGAERVEVIMTCYDAPTTSLRCLRERVRIGWIGSPATQANLELIEHPLKVVLRRNPEAELIVIGGAVPPGLRTVPSCYAVPWTMETEATLLQSLDIGLAPLRRTAHHDAKCGFKIVQYMAHGVPVIATDNPVHRQILGAAGTLVGSTDDWLAALEAVLGSESERCRMGSRGLDRAHVHFSKRVAIGAWSRILAELE